MGRAQRHVLSMFLRMRNATGRSMTYIHTGRSIHTNRVGIDLASTGLAALAPIITLERRLHWSGKNSFGVRGAPYLERRLLIKLRAKF